MSHFSFPLLSTKDIVNSLAVMGIGTVSADQLLKINSETASNLYECFVEYLYDSARDEAEQALFSGLEVLEDQDLHRESVGIMNRISKIRKIMKAAGAHDFSSKDIFKPEPQRTLKFLSALINFCRYREEKLLAVNSTMVECQQELEKKLQLENRKFELEQKLAEIEAERQSKKRQIEALEAEMRELTQTILSLNKQQSNLQAEVQALKEKNIDLTDKIRNADFLLLQKNQEATQQRSQIVQSPDKLQKALEEKRSRKAELELNVESAMEAFQKWNATVEAYSKAHKKVTKSLALVHSLQEQINSFKTVEKDVKTHKAKLKDAEKEDWTLEAKRVELQLEVEQLERSIKNTEIEKEAKYIELEKELDSLNAQIAPRLQQLELAEKKVAEKFAEGEYIRKRRLPEVSASKEALLNNMMNKMLLLAQQVKKYDELFLSRLEDIEASNEVLCGSTNN